MCVLCKKSFSAAQCKDRLNFLGCLTHYYEFVLMFCVVFYWSYKKRMFWQRLIYNKKNRQQCVDKLNIATLVLMACTLIVKMCTIVVLITRLQSEDAVNVSSNDTGLGAQ